MAAAGDDAPAGLFSGVWSRLHAAASFWRRPGQASGNGDGGHDDEEEEAAVRSRLARRAAAARRLGRKLAFVSFNLEVLVFVYAFWRARRRSLSWRLPTQALPILVVPALATLIYAAFVRFTRKLDLKDKKRLERLQEDKQQTDGEPRELVDQDDQNNVQDFDGVDDASSSSAAPDSVPNTPRLRKRRQPSMNKRDDGGADMAWGHSKDFQPMGSDGLRHRTFSSGKTYMTNSSATENSEENAQKMRSFSAYSDQHVHVPVSAEDTVSCPSDDHSGSAGPSMLAQPANTPQELPAQDGDREEFDGSWDITDTCSRSSKENLVPPAGPHNSFCDREESRSSELAIATAFQELLVKVNEEHSLSLPETPESAPAFIKEATASPPGGFVSRSNLNDLSLEMTDLVPPASETLKALPAEGLKEKALVEPPYTSAALQMYSITSEDNPITWCAVDDKGLRINSDVETYLLPPISSDVQDNAAFVNIDTVSPKWNLLLKLYGNEVEETKLSKFHIPEESTRPKSCLGTREFSSRSQETKKLEIVVEGSEDDIEEESCELNTKEENAALINMEEEVLQDPLTVSTSTSEQCLEASDISSCIQDAKEMEVPGVINFVTANPELMYTPSPEVLAEDHEEFKEDKASDLHLPEHTGVSFNFEEEPILDSPVADTAKHLLLTPLYTEEVDIKEVYDVVKEGCFESEDEESFNHGKLAVTHSSDDSNTQNLTSDAIPVQFIPNTDINEALEGGEEASSEPLHESSCQAEEIFLSSGETSNDEVYSSDSNSYAKLLEGLSKYQENMPIPGVINFVTANPELMYTPSPEVLAEDHEEFKEDKASDLHLPEHTGMSFNFEEEPILDSPVADTAKHLLLTPLYTEEVEIKEVYDVVKEGCFESEDEESFNHGKLAVTHSSDDSNTQNLTSDAIPVQFIPNTDINEALEGGEEASSEPLHESSCQAEEIFLSSGETSNDEVYSSDSNSYAKLLEGLSKYQENMPITFSDSPIFLDEVKTAAIVDSDASSPKLSLQTDLQTPFSLEEEVLLSPPAVNDGSLFNQLKFICQSAGTPEFSSCNHESEEMEVAGSDSFIEASPELSVLSPPKLVAEGGEDAREKESGGLNTEEENAPLINLEDEALQGELVVSTTDQSFETSEFSLSSQGAKMTDVPGIVSSFTVSPELSYPAFPELLVEGDEDLKEDETSDLLLDEQNDLPFNLEEPVLDPVVVNTAEDAVVTSEILRCSEEVKEVLSESEDEGAFDHGKLALTSPDDDNTAQNLTSNSVYAQFIPDVSEASQAGQEPLFELPHENTFRSEGTFLSSGEINHDEVKFETPFAGKEGPFKSEAEMALTPLDTSILLDEVHGVVKEVLSESEDEGASDHQKLVLSSPDDDDTIQTLTSNLIPAQFLRDASVKEVSQAGYEPLLEPPHKSTCQSEGAFSSLGEIDEVKAEAPVAGQEVLSKSEDEMALTPLDTSILLDEVRSAESSTDNSASSLSIPDSNGIQALHDHEQDPSEALQEVTSLLEGSHTSSDEGISSGNFSLYSRSSSCVSEINILETLRGGTSSEPQNDRDLSFGDRYPVTFPNLDSTESNTNDPVTAEFILETNIIETLSAAEEANAGSPHEVSSNFLGSFVAPDVINDMTESDSHLDLSSSSFAPVVDVFESLQTGQSFSELQSEEDFTVQETQISPEEFNNAENYAANTIWDPEDGEGTPVVALQDEDALTHHRAYMSLEDLSDVENSLADDYASDLPHTMDSHFFSEKLSPESQDPLSSEEILVYPDEGSNAENDLGSANSSLCSREVSLAEPLGIDQEGTPQHDGTMLGPEGIFTLDQEANSENLCNNSGSLDIPDVIMADSLQVADKVSSEILYDGMSSFEGTLLSFDGDDSAEEDSPNNSGSVTHTAQINTASLPGLQEGSFKPEDEQTVHSISPYEVDTEETSYSSVSAKDKEPKEDGECKDKIEDVEDSEDDHESNPKPSVELYANDAPWRDSALIGTSYDFDMAVRKPVVTIRGSEETIFELADVQYTALDDDDDDTETLGYPLPSSVATE